MFAVKPDNLTWTPGKQPGVTRAIVWEVPGGGRALFVRMAKGATIESHGHIGSEDLYLVSGRMRLGQDTLEPGDYHHTSAGEQHDAEAFEDTVFFAVTEKVIAGR